MMDGRESVRYRAFSRRTAIVSAGTLGLFTLLTGRMFQLSVLQNDQFAMLAEDNRINLQLVAPRRGRLYDRVGVELANTAQNFRVLLVPEQTKNPRAVLEQLAQLVPNLSPQRIQRVLRDIGRGKKFNPVLVVEGLSWEDFAKVNINTPDLTGIVPDVGELRSYPYGAWLSHVLGYVAGVTDKDIEKQPELLSLPGFRMGRSGVEKAADDALRGTPGASNVEVNAHGRVIRELSRREGTPGQDVVLSLDMEVQKIAQEKLAGQSGSVVVMDVETGEIISIVSAPGFDPNAFTGTVSPTIWKQLNEDELKPLLNKAITGIYPPGSTYKPIVALAALASGAMTPQARVHCSGARQLGSHVFHCWKRGGHGSMDMHSAIKQSCDSYFYECARRTGIEAIAAMSRKFGLGQVYGLEIPGEKSGLMPDPEWKLRARKDSWRDGDTFNVGIGQGAVLTTPLQLCVMTARLANGGKAVMPHVIRSFGGVERVLPPPEDMGLDPAHVAIVHSGMDAVTNQGGTGARSRIDIEGFDMAGKTGTAQVRRLTAELRGRSADSIPWKFRDHALFIAFAPVDKPRYAISVVVEHGGGGSKTAAPIAKDVMTLVAQRDPARQKLFVPPSRTVAVANERV
ncbi:MAG: penicillin-binding protein 2 [Alphaproteobacteria bacterium]|jgi:penicillin-binding protein 2|nr:penicillin-binding protein 2 [Alphaproteobacteria bacterium]